MRADTSFTVALGFALGSLLFVSEVAAQSTIKLPGQRPHYAFEAEPHLLVGPFDPPGWPRGEGLGVGFRGTVEVAPNGFIKTINNSVGITFGADWVRYPYGDPRGICTERVNGPNGTSVCVEVDGGNGAPDYFYLPVAMQWNFWLARRWSVFAEPGILPYFRDGQLGFTPLALYVGGRFHFSDKVALTFRLGYPTLSLGASFFL